MLPHNYQIHEGAYIIPVKEQMRPLFNGNNNFAFETLTRDGVEIAAHADIEDEAQTVELVVPEKDTPGKGYPKTGGSVPVAPIAASIVVIAGCGAAGAAYALGKRRKARNADSDTADTGDE